LVLRERLPPQRALGALVIVVGLLAIGGEAVTTIGSRGVVGDLMFVAAGCMFGTFGMLLRLWRVDAIRGTVAVGDPNVGALHRERLRDRFADAGATASNECDATLKVEIHIGRVAFFGAA